MGKFFNTTDSFVIVIITFFALFTRLWLIADPDRVTFDEVHFGNFSSWYIQKRFHFDIHPPLGKLLMTTIAKWTQYKGGIHYTENFGKHYEFNDLYFVSQRITPAIFSAFTTPLMFAACRCLSISTFSSACAGIILSTDLSLIVEGKFILSDGMLHFFTMLHIFALCLFLGQSNYFRLIFTSITLGLASACKYTALCLYALDGMTQLVWIYLNRPTIRRIIIRAYRFLFPSFITLFLVWVWHFISTPYDGYNSEYISQSHASTIIPYSQKDYAYFGNRIRGSFLIARIIFWNVVMNNINMRSDIPHPYGSMPINWWLLRDKWVGFLSASHNTRQIYCMGSPACYIFSSIAIILTIIIAFIHFFVNNIKCLQKFNFNLHPDWRNALFIWGWMVSYFPFLLVPRTMFLYHYLIPLMFAILNMIALVENCTTKQARGFILTLLTTLCILCYLFFSPWVYGIRCPDCEATRLWSERWSTGPPKPIHNFGIELYNTTEMERDLNV